MDNLETRKVRAMVLSHNVMPLQVNTSMKFHSKKGTTRQNHFLGPLRADNPQTAKVRVRVLSHSMQPLMISISVKFQSDIFHIIKA